MTHMQIIQRQCLICKSYKDNATYANHTKTMTYMQTIQRECHMCKAYKDNDTFTNHNKDNDTYAKHTKTMTDVLTTPTMTIYTHSKTQQTHVTK